jgi:predicted transporter
MSVPTPGGGGGCPVVLGGLASTLTLASCGALAPAGVPLAVRALLFLAIFGVVGALVVAAFRLATTTPVPVPEEVTSLA